MGVEQPLQTRRSRSSRASSSSAQSQGGPTAQYATQRMRRASIAWASTRSRAGGSSLRSSTPDAGSQRRSRSPTTRSHPFLLILLSPSIFRAFARLPVCFRTVGNLTIHAMTLCTLPPLQLHHTLYYTTPHVGATQLAADRCSPPQLARTQVCDDSCSRMRLPT